MAWRCTQCGTINDDDSPRCVVPGCNFEKPRLEQPRLKLGHSRPGPFKHSEAKDLILATILMFVIWLLIYFVMRNNDLATFYGWIASQSAAIYFLNRKYRLKLFSSVNSRLVCKYGLGAGVILLGWDFLSYIGHKDYNVFTHYSGFRKFIFFVYLIALSPVAEEILFRGFFYRILKARYNIWVGTTFSILLYAALCGDFSASFLLLGFVFTFVYEKSDAVWGSVITHTIGNFGYVFFHYLV